MLFQKIDLVKYHLSIGESKSGEIMVTETSTYKPCPHDTGWFDTISTWYGRRKVFVCEKCMSILDLKTKRQV